MKKPAPNQVDKNERPLEEKLPTSEKKPIGRSIFDITISTKTFVISHLLIFILSAGFLIGVHFYLDSDFPKFNPKTYIPVTKPPTSFSLNINNPEDELLSSDKTLTISGSTAPKATIILVNSGLTNKTTTGFQANTKGEFTKIINLFDGVNILTISAFDIKGNIKTETRTIYYEKEVLQ